MSKYIGIKNIVFDLGAVLFDLDYKLSVEAFKRLGIDDPRKLFSEKGQVELFSEFERGEIGSSEFIEGINGFLPSKAKAQQIMDSWNAMLLGLPKTSIELLNNLRDKYNLYLLSNTNDLHFERFHEMIKQDHGLDRLEGFFKKIYYSHHEGLKKPEPEIYLRLIDREGLLPSETVFIDDMERNVKGAESVGIVGIWLENGDSVLELFDEHFTLKG